MYSPIELAAWCGGTWHGNASRSATFNGVFTDTRNPVPGALFIALKGEKFDGHDYIGQAAAAGAAAALVDEVELRNCGIAELRNFPLLAVKDTSVALTKIAAGYRAKINPRVVGITGSAGKTTVKEWSAALLSAQFKTHKTSGNFNNHIGVPLSILAMPPDTEAAVFEVGTNHPGEIAPLAALAKPDVAIITNIGTAHIENFGSSDAIANEKADLVRALPSNGIAILDADSPHFTYLSAQSPCRVISTRDFPISDTDISTGAFTIDSHRIHTGQSGSHNITNALLAIAAARVMGVTWENIQAAFTNIRNAPALEGRWQRIVKNGVVFINDAYNANPVSMEKALERFAMERAAGRKIAVLGDMFELGALAPDAHRAVGGCAAKSGLDLLVAVGAMSSGHMVAGAIAAGMPASRIITFENTGAAKRGFAGLAGEGDSVLLKASHSMRLDTLI